MNRTQRTRVLAATLSLAAAGGAAFAAEREETKKIAEVRLRGSVTEAPPPELLMFGFDAEKPTALKSILQRLKTAKQDPQVAGVLLTLDSPEMGWAQVQEIRKALLDLRAADKDVYCHVEAAGNAMYVLASAATHLSIEPTGEVGLMGIHAEMPYLKGLLDKIHVEADMEHIGEYKGAAEPFTRTGPSPEAEAQQNWLLDDLFAQIVDAVAETRGLSPERVRELIDNGPYLADHALKAKLVDAVEYRQDFLDRIKRKHGKSVRFVKNYAADSGPEIDFSSPFALFEALGRMMKGREEATDKPVVAVVYLDGMIVAGPSQESLFGSKIAGSTTLRAVLDKAREDDKVKAVVLRIDSPGGSALASETIWHAAKLCGEKKPLVVSMGNIAASGGYYVASAGSTIFADAGTITGSIGVVGGKIITKGLWDWAGVTFHESQRGRNADLFNTNRRFDERQRAVVRKEMEEVYGVFVSRVKEGRGKKLTEDIDKIARGRVYTGQLAVKKGLVDEIGGLDRAVAFAAEKAGVDDYRIRVLPRPKNLMDMFRKSLGGDGDEDVSVTAAAKWPITAPAMQMLGSALEQIDAARARMVVRLLLRLDLLRRESVLAVMPEEFVLNGMGR